MIQEIGDRHFDNQFRPGAVPEPDDYVFAFRKPEKGPDLIMISGDETGIIDIPKMKDLGLSAEQVYYAFAIDDDRYYIARPGISPDECGEFKYVKNRILRQAIPRDKSMAAMTACHLNIWYKDNLFCGRCGTEAVHDDKLRMMHCPKCGNMIFPKLCPAVTVAVRHEDKLLVSRYAGREQTGNYALIAGFVEIGESTEECVAREVMEEVGLKVKNIRYFGSQPWGYVGNLQIGYVCEVDGSAEIELDEEELALARFVTRDELMPLEHRPALTQEMIEAFRLGKL